MNMFKPVKAKTIEQYLEAVPPNQSEAMHFLHEFILKTVPELKPRFASNMIGYGEFPYRNNKKELLMWPIIALANQKNYISIYVCATDGIQYLAEKHATELGNVSVGKSCIRLKKKEDIHLPALETLLKLAAKSPGLVGTKEV